MQVSRRACSAGRGVALIEAMVAALLLAIGLLTLGRWLARDMAELRNAGNRAVASRQIEALRESMAVNASAAGLGFYNLAWNEKRSAALDCRLVRCHAGQRADHDLDLWQHSLEAALPSAVASVFPLPGSTQFGIAVGWTSGESADNPEDASLPASMTEVTLANSGIDCPPRHLCQVGHALP